MKSLVSFSKILICREPVDGRKQINTLAHIVEQGLGEPLFDGSLFVFINRRRDLLKILYYDQTGFALWIKRLEKEKFFWLKWPSSSGANTVTSSQLSMLLEGYDIFKVKPHEKVLAKRFS